MSNTIWAMRLLQQLQRGPQPALLPLTTAEPEREPKSRGGARSRRSPSPDRRRSKAKRSPPPPKDRRRRARSPSSSSEEDKAYGSPSESDYSSYDEPEAIKQRYAKDPCEFVSPAGLRDKKSKKEVVNYLEEKKCPKIEINAKKRKHVAPDASATTSAPAPSVSTPAPPPPPDHPNPPAPVPPPAPVVKDSIAAPKKLGRPKKPVDPNAKPKRAPTAYNLAVSKYRKEGLSMSDASKKAKEDTKKPV